MSSNAPSIFYGDIVAPFIKTTGAGIVPPVVDGSVIFYAPLMEELFSPWVSDPKEVESLNDLVIAKKFNFIKDCFHHSFGDDTTTLRTHSVRIFHPPSQASCWCTFILSPWDLAGNLSSVSMSDCVRSIPSPSARWLIPLESSFSSPGHYLNLRSRLFPRSLHPSICSSNYSIDAIHG
ncbi:hypothetical protein HAX54_029896 [Datura stramonium]|uniref:Uncharacterized protein n=1 Tax=Datura stramonium TaxID=4076 RepID=A0ABS8V914_DATST|nr:hypothetical protein [Datura stramonium]